MTFRAGTSRATSLTASALWPGAGNVLILALALIATGAMVGHMVTAPGHRPARTSATLLASTDKKLAAAARNIDRSAVGETRVATYLGDEFGMSPQAVLAQRADLRASWGDLTVAHTLAASDVGGMTVAQLLQLRNRGMGWGAIVAGLHLEMSDAVHAVIAEGRVARGLLKADGKTALIAHDGL